MEKNDKSISIKSFVTLLYEQFEPAMRGKVAEGRTVELNDATLIKHGHQRGWLEDQDERFCDSLVDKRTAARIIHNFMRIELKIPDLTDINGAQFLKDLYTCHICVNHVSQIYLRGIMQAESVEINGENVLIFNMLKPLTENEALESINKLLAVLKS